MDVSLTEFLLNFFIVTYHMCCGFLNFSVVRKVWKHHWDCWYHMYYLFYAVGLLAVGLLTFGISRVFVYFFNPKKGGGIRMFIIGWYPKEAIQRLIPVEITYATHPSDSDQRMPSMPFMRVYSTLVSLFGWSSPLVCGLFAEDAVSHFQNWFT